MQNFREKNELRMLGASFVCARRTQKDELAFLLVKDTPKKEVSAGLKKWVVASQPALCYPGGGRSVTENGQPETREQTLQNELKEEMKLALSVAFLTSGLVQRYPFVVGQEKLSIINQIGVTTALYWFDAFGQPAQTFIDDMCKSEQAQWASVADLLLFWNTFTQQESADSLFRPQVLTTAYLWSIYLLEGWSDEAILLATNDMNKKTVQFIQSEAKKRGLLIQNGAFSGDGSILLPNQLSEQDAQFLYKEGISQKV